jgi:GNAT superfamily N-acetyltransferase
VSDAASILIRRAAPEDATTAAPLFDAYRRFYGMAPDVDAARAFLAERLARGESVVLLACAPEEPIGFAQLYPSFSSIALGAVMVLNDLFVAPGSRRAGVARQLVEAAASHAARAGAIRLELATQHTNAPARRLYASLGFVADTEFAHLSLALRDALPV